MMEPGRRVGPFEIVRPLSVPEDGDWFLAQRAGITTREPAEVLVRLLREDASEADREALSTAFKRLKSLDDRRIPVAVAHYEGAGAIAVDAPPVISLNELIALRADDAAPMDPATLLDLALEITETIVAAHHKGRHHGHLHGGSIGLDIAGGVWVWGYGPGPASTPPEAWMPPERALGRPVSGATDQWGLGALIAALITGRPPWTSQTPKMEARRGDPRMVVGPVEAQWPALGRLLRKLMAQDPANRFPSIHPARKTLLSLSRKARSTSMRRELASLLFRAATEPEVVAEEAVVAEPLVEQPGGAPSAPAEVAPTSAPVDETALAEEEARAAPAASAPAASAPAASVPASAAISPEPMPVVRPEVGSGGPKRAFIEGLPEEAQDPTEPSDAGIDLSGDVPLAFTPFNPSKDPLDPPTLPGEALFPSPPSPSSDPPMPDPSTAPAVAPVEVPISPEILPVVAILTPTPPSIPVPAGPTVVPVTDPGADSQATDGAEPESLSDAVDQVSLGIDASDAREEPSFTFTPPDDLIKVAHPPNQPASSGGLDPRQIAPYALGAALVVSALYLLLT